METWICGGKFSCFMFCVLFGWCGLVWSVALGLFVRVYSPLVVGPQFQTSALHVFFIYNFQVFQFNLYKVDCGSETS